MRRSMTAPQLGQQVLRRLAHFHRRQQLQLAAVAATLVLTGVAQAQPNDFSTYKKPSADELHKQLTPLQYEVTQEEGTERAFSDGYWNNHENGIYVDVVSGEPLFSSTDKFESGTGWPSFTKPLVAANIVTKEDHKFFGVRTEVRSKHANSHLGHVFDDGPAPTGLRYCMNSASLRFIPASKLQAEGYGEFAALFASAGAGKKTP